MADAAWALSGLRRVSVVIPRHSVVVRITHWITTFCFIALTISGANIVISHPRFYWGETGNVLTPALFQIPIPASRSSVQTGYSYRLPDQNGWSRSLHFQSAWLIVFTGLVYVVYSVVTRHLSRDLLPDGHNLLRWQTAPIDNVEAYNSIQRLTYLAVVFALFPLMIWTGLAMSPTVVSVFPGFAQSVGGHQSARTIHFFGTLLLVGFLVVHVWMVYRAGFVLRTRAMITGQLSGPEEGR